MVAAASPLDDRCRWWWWGVVGQWSYASDERAFEESPCRLQEMAPVGISGRWPT
jgi:hypothetical protein